VVIAARRTTVREISVGVACGDEPARERPTDVTQLAVGD